jgi:uncharacterized protein YukE
VRDVEPDDLDGYRENRRHETWSEVHKPGRGDRARIRANQRKRRRNRQVANFGKVNWDAYQHYQLYDMIMSAKVPEMSARAEQWTALAGKIRETTDDVQRVMQRVTAAWRGDAAVAAADSTSRLMQWAGDASNTADKVSEGMSNYTSAVADAQARMPEPAFSTAERRFRDGYTVEGTGGPSTAVLVNQLLSDGMASHERDRQNKAEAVAVMESYEGQSKDVHDTMPHFTDAAAVGPGPSGAPQPTPSPHPQPAPGPGGGPLPTPGGVDTMTTAAGFVEPGLGGGSTTGGPGGYGGGLGSLGSGGSDVLRNSPGLGGAAGVGAVPGRGPGALGAANAAGARGGAGAFGGAPVGHGANGEDDKEHKNKYDEGLDLFDDLPPAYPSVFGA